MSIRNPRDMDEVIGWWVLGMGLGGAGLLTLAVIERWVALLVVVGFIFSVAGAMALAVQAMRWYDDRRKHG